MPSPAIRRRPQRSDSKKETEPAGVRLTNPQRVLYPEQGITKRELAEYYQQIADWVLPHLVQRPLTLVRCPRGAQEKCFYQKHLAESLPEPIRGIQVKDDGGTHQYVAIDDVQGLTALVQMSVLELHPWGSREDNLESPDRMVLDLDPGPGIEWKQVVASAQELGAVLKEIGLVSFVRTTGGKGLHLVVPLVRRHTWDAVKEFAQAISDFMARHDPSLYVATPSKARRTKKIYLDYLRNARGATAIASYSTRAKPGAPVATPLEWNEVSPRVDPAQLTVATIPDRLAALRRDPWKDFATTQQSLTQTMRRKLAR